MGKKNKIPFALRIIPILFPKLEAIAPSIAKKFFVYIFFTPMRYGVPEKEKQVADTSIKERVLIGDKHVQFYSWGDANRPAILFVHGWAGRATQFRKFVEPVLAKGFKMVAFDAPAHGLSEGRKTDLEEFRKVIEYACKKHEVSGIVTHSFGGAATLYALTKGLSVKSVVNIASPTVGDEIIKTYLRAINGSEKTGEYFRKYVQEKTGKSFDSFTAMGFIDEVPKDIHLLLLHDQDDKDVIIDQPRALKQKFPQATLVETQGLGHTRILKDDHVIQKAVTFVSQHSSME